MTTIYVAGNLYLQLPEAVVDEVVSQLKEQMMADAKSYADQLTQVANDLKAAVAPIPGAIDGFEARITQLVKDSGVPADVAAQFDAALSDLRSTITNVNTAVADAADGVDEAAAGDTGGGTGGGTVGEIPNA